MLSKTKLLNWAKNNNKVTLTWLEIQYISGQENYDCLVSDIKGLVEEEVLKPVGKKTNGRKPSLNEKYKAIMEEEDYSEYIQEIDYVLNPMFKKSYYRRNVKNYLKNRENILMLNKYVNENQDLLETELTINERSFEIFKREKFMKETVFETMIKNLGIEKEFFNCRKTVEPMPYRSLEMKTCQNVLFVENRDTYSSIIKYIQEVSSNVLGVDINTVVYTSGKGKMPSIEDLEYATDKYVASKDNTFYYFGDIDYEGIAMFGSYSVRASKEGIHIKPFVPAYEYMLDKMIDEIELLPKTKEGQRENMEEVFYREFDDMYKDKFEKVLSVRKYIPQEAFNYRDLINYGKRRK